MFSRRLSKITCAVLVVALIGSLASCATDDPVPALTTLNVTLPLPTLTAGLTQTATVAGLDQNGAAIGTGTIAWASSTQTVATINPTSGVITALAAGTTTITATSGTITGQQTLTVSTAPPVLTTVVVTLPFTTAAVGQTETASAAGLDQYGGAIGVGTVAWASSTQGVATINPTSGLITAVAAGTTTITATSGTKSGQRTLTVAAPAAIKINEVESNGGTPGDWVEFYNPTAASVDLSGWVVKDNDDTHIYTFPAGTTIAASGYLVADEANIVFGLGSADAVRLYSPFSVLVETYAWTVHAATTYGRCPNLTGALTTSTSSTKGTANDCSLGVRINEVESNGGVPGDWIELINGSPTAVDLSGYIVKDNDDTHNYTLPAGSVIAPGAYLVVEEAALGFGLGSADAARLLTATLVLVDSYTWDTHASTTYGRCVDGTGTFTTTVASTKGTPNTCGAGPVIAPWPGSDDVTTVDGVSVFQTNLSGLFYEGAGGGNPAVLWAGRNGPGTVYRLIFNGTIWTPDPANGWAAGKAGKYLDGTGNPDTEGITCALTCATGGIYISTERNNDASTISRNSILRYDAAQAGTSLTATNDWNITADLPAVGANLGIEDITWIPDAFLVAQGFFDEQAGHAYNPAEYPSHNGGIFFVGLEANGLIYAYALDHANSTFKRVATITTGFAGVMALQFDRELNYLWATCDDGCGNKAETLEIDVGAGSPTRGRFLPTHLFDKPGTLPNINNEGFAFAPQSECVAGLKPVFWADDGETGGHSIRKARISCVRFP